MSSRNVITSHRFRSLTSQRVPAITSALVVLVALGCGGSAGTHSAPGSVPTVTQDPVPPVPIDQTAFTVNFYTAGGQFLVEKLEMEFYGGRRGKFYFWGFFRDQYDQPVQVDFRDLLRVDFIEQMNRSLFDQATINREGLGLRIDNAFQLRLHFRNGDQQEFFAFIPKLRGVKDFQIWELNMDSTTRQFLYLEFMP